MAQTAAGRVWRVLFLVNAWGLLPSGGLLLLLLFGRCIPLMSIVGVTIENRTGQVLHVTPVNQGRPLPLYQSRCPTVPLFRGTDLPINSGSSLTVYHDYNEGTRMTDVVIQDSHGVLYQLRTAEWEEPPAGIELTTGGWVIRDLSRLPPPDPAALQAVEAARSGPADQELIVRAVCLVPWLTLVPVALLGRRSRRPCPTLPIDPARSR